MKALKNKKYRELLLYGVIGGASATLDFVIYSTLLYFISEKYLIIANTTGVSCGIITSFLLNRQFNFKVKDRTVLRFISFLTVGLIGLLISSGLIIIFVNHLRINFITAKLATIVFVSIIQFVLNKLITFKTNKNAKGDNLHRDAGL